MVVPVPLPEGLGEGLREKVPETDDVCVALCASEALGVREEVVEPLVEGDGVAELLRDEERLPVREAEGLDVVVWVREADADPEAEMVVVDVADPEEVSVMDRRRDAVRDGDADLLHDTDVDSDGVWVVEGVRLSVPEAEHVDTVREADLGVRDGVLDRECVPVSVAWGVHVAVGVREREAVETEGEVVEVQVEDGVLVGVAVGLGPLTVGTWVRERLGVWEGVREQEGAVGLGEGGDCEGLGLGVVLADAVALRGREHEGVREQVVGVRLVVQLWALREGERVEETVEEGVAVRVGVDVGAEQEAVKVCEGVAVLERLPVGVVEGEREGDSVWRDGVREVDTEGEEWEKVGEGLCDADGVGVVLRLPQAVVLQVRLGLPEGLGEGGLRVRLAVGVQPGDRVSDEE